jgi:hypothetical protein
LFSIQIEGGQKHRTGLQIDTAEFSSCAPSARPSTYTFKLTSHCKPHLPYKSTDGILSHCKTGLDVAIVYRAVYHALPVISRNSSIACGARYVPNTQLFEHTVPQRTDSLRFVNHIFSRCAAALSNKRYPTNQGSNPRVMQRQAKSESWTQTPELANCRFHRLPPKPHVDSMAR